MSPILLAVIRFIGRRILPSFLTVRNNFSFTHDRSNCSSPHFTSTTLQNLQSISVLYFPKRRSFRATHSYAPNVPFTRDFLKFKPSSLVKRVFFLLSATFVILHHLSLYYTNSISIPHSPVFFIYYNQYWGRLF